MAIYKENIVDINLETGNIHRSFLNHSIGKADNGADHFGIRVYRDGVAVDLTGVAVQGFFRDPIGNNIAITSGNVVSGNVAKVVLPQACYNYDGPFTLAIKLIGGDVTGTMRIVDGIISNTNTGGAVAPTETVPSYQEILSVYEEMLEAVENAAELEENIAPLFDVGTANKKDSYVMHDGKLYMLPDGHEENVPWDNTTKTEAIMGEKVANAVTQIGARQNTSSDTVIRDANNAEANRIYTITDSSACDHLPSGYAGTLATFNGDASYTAGQMQMYVNEVGQLYTRMRWGGSGGTWTAWIRTADFNYAMMQIGARQNTSSDTVIPDANNADANRIYTITDATACDNLPSAYAGTLATFNGDASFTSGQIQIYVASNAEMFIRIRWGAQGGSWSDWASVDTYGLKSRFANISMFSNFGVIGDSFANGLVVTDQYPDGIEVAASAWGNILAKRSGIPATIYGWSGVGTYEFTNSSNPNYNTRGYGKLVSDLSEDKKDLYLLCLGINDSNNTSTFGDKTGGLAYLGSSADVNLSDYTQNANSFWGNYGRIIQTIKAQSPKSRIVMCTFCRKPTPATAEGYTPYIEAIKAIAEFFSLPCIVLTNDPYFNSDFYMDNMVGYHPTPPQYAGYAEGIERLLSKVMVTDYVYFRSFIGVN